MPPAILFQMFYDSSPDCLNWKPWKVVENVEEISDSEKVIRFQPDVSWAVKSIAGIPEWISGRIVAKRNWPEENNFAFAIIPWDSEKNVAVNQIGPMMISSGVVMPNPDDP